MDSVSALTLSFLQHSGVLDPAAYLSSLVVMQLLLCSVCRLTVQFRHPCCISEKRIGIVFCLSGIEYRVKFDCQWVFKQSWLLMVIKIISLGL